MPGRRAPRSMWCDCGCLLDGDNTRCSTCRGEAPLFDVCELREQHATRVSFAITDPKDAALVLGEVSW